MKELEYNSARKKLLMSEYGRNIQNMVDHVANIKDKDERTKAAKTVIGLMGQMNPHLRDVADFKHKLWDHLHMISDYKIDVDSPFPPPEPGSLYIKPGKVEYPKHNIRIRLYGRNLQLMVDKAKEMKEGSARTAFIESIANFMKLAHRQWNREQVNDEVIFENLKTLSDGAIDVDSSTINITQTTNYEKRSKPKRRDGRDGRDGRDNRYRKR